MASIERDIESIEVSEPKLWAEGPPYELFKELRAGCPVHWTPRHRAVPAGAGFWSVTTAEDVHTVSRDWRDLLLRTRRHHRRSPRSFPIELARAMFIGMDPPKHDRLKALFQAGFTPKRIADHEERIREIVVDVLDRLEGRETCDLVSDVAQPVVSRVIGSFMGIARGRRRGLGAADELGARRRTTPTSTPDGHRQRASRRTSPRSSRAAAS